MYLSSVHLFLLAFASKVIGCLTCAYSKRRLACLSIALDFCGCQVTTTVNNESQLRSNDLS